MRLVDLDMWRQHSSGHPILDLHSLPAAYHPFKRPSISRGCHDAMQALVFKRTLNVSSLKHLRRQAPFGRQASVTRWQGVS